jgi:hypothetical protein
MTEAWKSNSLREVSNASHNFEGKDCFRDARVNAIKMKGT